MLFKLATSKFKAALADPNLPWAKLLKDMNDTKLILDVKVTHLKQSLLTIISTDFGIFLENLDGRPAQLCPVQHRPKTDKGHYRGEMSSMLCNYDMYCCVTMLFLG